MKMQKTPTTPSKKVLSLLMFPTFLFLTACMCTELPGQILGTVQTAATAQSVYEEVRTQLPAGIELTLQSGGDAIQTLQADPTAMAQVQEAVRQAQTSVPGIEETAQAALADPTLRAMAEGVLGELPEGIELTAQAVLGGEEGLGGVFGTILEDAQEAVENAGSEAQTDTTVEQPIEDAIDVDPAIVDGKVLGLPVLLNARDLISSDLGGNASVTYLTETAHDEIVTFYKTEMLAQGYELQTESTQTDPDTGAKTAALIFVVEGKQVVVSITPEADGRQRITLASVNA